MAECAGMARCLIEMPRLAGRAAAFEGLSHTEADSESAFQQFRCRWQQLPATRIMQPQKLAAAS